MKKLLAFFEKHVVPVMEKLNKNIWVNTIKDAIFATLPMTMLGSLFCLLTVLGEVGLGDFWFSFWTPWSWTMGLVAVFTAFLIPIFYLEKKKIRKNRFAGALSAVALFLMIANTQCTEPGLAQSVLGAGGMFVAIISGVISSLVLGAFGKFSFFKEDSPMPDFVRSWFDQMLPVGLIVLGGWLLLDVVGVDIFGIIQTIFSPIQNFYSSTLGMFVVVLMYSINYSMGISNWVFNPITSPLATNVTIYNMELAKAGLATSKNLLVHSSAALYSCYVYLGGEGSTFCLNILGLFSKSPKIKALARACLPTTIFNINEPIVFGMVAWNPYLMMGMWVTTMVACFVYVLFTKIIPFAPIPTIQFGGWYIPFPISTFMATQSFKAVILWAIELAVQFVTWFPFFKMYEAAELKKDAELIKNKKANEA